MSNHPPIPSRSALFLAFLAVAIFAQPLFAEVRVYPAPGGITMSGDYIVKVGGQTCPVYRGTGPIPYSFASFDFSGSAPVEITSVARSLSSVVVRPASKGIVPTVTGNVMKFTVTKNYTHLSIEPSAKVGALLLFANPIDVPPALNTPGLRYFGPGLHKPNMINLTSGQTLYLAGGAVVQAGVYANGSNITIRGRGILDGLPWPASRGPQPSGGTTAMIRADRCTDLTVEGIIAKDAWHSTVNNLACVKATYTNFKIVGNRSDTVPDGFHDYQSQWVTIADSFIRCDDDCIAPIVQWSSNPVAAHYRVTRCSLWTDRANIWRIGSGWQGLGVASAPMNDFVFTDIDVLHYDSYFGDIQNPVAVLAGNRDQAVNNIHFDNIRINREGQSELWHVIPTVNTNRPITDCTFKNIFVTGNAGSGLGAIRVSGPDAQSYVNNITFQNFVRHGQVTQRTSAQVIIGGNTSNIFFITGTAPAPVPAPAPAPAPVPAPSGTSDVIVTALAYANGIFTCTVKNQGGAATPAGVAIGVGFFVDGTWRAAGFTAAPLQAGASASVISSSYAIPNGTHTINAWVDDANRFGESNENNNQLSQAITVGTTPSPTAQAPYGGSAWQVPGTIQAENFDVGGEGVAYHDVDASNHGGAYRTGGVDLYAGHDGGTIVGATKAGEWLEYTVNVATAGNYTLEARVSSIDSGGKFHVEFNGVNKTGTITMPAYTGTMTWSTQTRTVSLAAGQQVMRIAFDTNGTTNATLAEVANVNHIRLVAQTPVGTG
jgi:hypothetical protein